MKQITKLQPGEVFVFGSNTAGIHGRGAALQARIQWGAKPGVGEGLTGYKDCCYALPTLNAVTESHRTRLDQRTREELVESFRKFFQCACANPDKVFLLTKVGCGLAGYTEDFVKSAMEEAEASMDSEFFVKANIVFPEGW